MRESEVFPFDIIPLDTKLDDELKSFFKGEKVGFVQVGPEKYTLPKRFQEEAQLFYSFASRPSDVWVVGLPCSGLDLIQEIVWLICNDMDFDTAGTKHLDERFPFFEQSLLVNGQLKRQWLEDNDDDDDAKDLIEKISRPNYKILSKIDPRKQRFIHTHLPFSLLPPSIMENRCKIIYVSRNPKDLARSLHKNNALYGTSNFIGTFIEFWDFFERGLCIWTPYYSHLKESLQVQHLPFILRVSYESILEDMNVAILRIAKFLGKPLSAENLSSILVHCEKAEFRANEMVNHRYLEIIRGYVVQRGREFSVISLFSVPKGRNEFAENLHLNERADNWIKTNDQMLVKNRLK